MHRVFRTPADVFEIAGPLVAVRTEFRALGLIEAAVGPAFEYHVRRGAAGTALFATLHLQGHSATIYLYPDALGGRPGVATGFYLRLDEAGFGLGSKLGPSISFDPEDAAQRGMFFTGLRAVLRAASEG